MRCKACNSLLTISEDKRKSLVTGDELGLCNRCLHPILPDLVESIDAEDDIWDDPDIFDYFDEEDEDDTSERESDEGGFSAS